MYIANFSELAWTASLTKKVRVPGLARSVSKLKSTILTSSTCRGLLAWGMTVFGLSSRHSPGTTVTSLEGRLAGSTVRVRERVYHSRS